MDLRRLRAGEWVAGLSGAGLIATLSLPWYDGEVSAWEALAVLDVLLVSAGVFAISLIVITATQRTVAIPIATAAATALLGVAATLAATFRVLVLPDLAAHRSAGVFLGLAASAGIFAGGLLAMRDERQDGGEEAIDATGRRARSREPVETLPPPVAGVSAGAAPARPDSEG
jgi:hypothetical protein